jgi:hypothetical protein
MSRLFIASLLLSSSVFSASAMASAPSSDVPTSNSVAATRYVAPHLLNPSELHIAPSNMTDGVPANGSMLVSMNVDSYGHAKNVRVLRTFSPEMSFRVAEAISRARFQPATFNNHAISAPLNLVVNVQ